MKKVISIITSFLFAVSVVVAQDDIYPAPPQTGTIYITHATVHVGNGQVISNGTIEIKNGKITAVGTSVTISDNAAAIVDASGKQVYPGMILPDCDLGLREIAGNAVRGSNDFAELGDWNTNIRSIVAYNADSRIIGTLRANGILLANVSPLGGLLPGTSTVVNLDAWSWEEAAYKTDNGIHFNMPSLLNRPRGGGGGGGRFQQQAGDPVKRALDNIEGVKKIFRDAKAYLGEASHKETNLKFEAVKGLFDKTQKFFVHCGQVKQMLIAIDFVKEFGFNVVIVGGTDSWMIADLLKQNNVAVILGREFELPTMEDDDIDQPFKTPAMLQKAGVAFCLNDDHAEARYRNLAFNAGEAVAYGLDKEKAIEAITLAAAKILGIDDRTGSIETGKDANIIISEGDLLDMRTSVITAAFIQGRKVSLENKQTQLFERYKYKYGIK